MKILNKHAAFISDPVQNWHNLDFKKFLRKVCLNEDSYPCMGN